MIENKHVWFSANSIKIINFQVLCPHEVSYARIDTEFASWFSTDCLLANLRTEIDSVYVKTNPSVTSDSSEGKLIGA